MIPNKLRITITHTHIFSSFASPSLSFFSLSFLFSFHREFEIYPRKTNKQIHQTKFFRKTMFFLFSSSSCYYLLSMFVVTFCLSNGKKHTHTHTCVSPSWFHLLVVCLEKTKSTDRIEYMYVWNFPFSLLFISSSFSPRLFTLCNVISCPFVTHIHIHKLSFSLVLLLFLSFRKILCFPPSVSLIS